MHNHNERSWHHEYPETRIINAFGLILIGIVLLLNTTGALGWGVWLNLLKLWPLILVNIGISLVFSWSRFSKLVGSVLNFLIFAGAVIIAATAQTGTLNLNIFNIVSFSGEELTTTQTITPQDYPVQEVERMGLRIDVGAGEFQVQNSNTDSYLELTSTYHKSFGEPNVSKELSNGDLQVAFSESSKRGAIILGSNYPKHTFELGNTKVATSFDVKLGAGNGVINLAGTQIDSLVADVGAGSLELTFDQASIPQTRLDLKVGLGNIKLTLQEEFGFKINYKVGLGTINVYGEEIAGAFGKDGTFESENYKTAENSIEINMDVGLGNIEVTN